MNIDKELLDNRIIILNDEVNEESASDIIKKLLYLDSQNNEDIHLYINSPGGVVTQGLAIIDCMNYIKSDICTLCYGQACSMGAVILAAGTKSKRYALPNAEIMIHEVTGGAYGNIDDLSITYNKMHQKRDTIIDILTKATSRTKKEIESGIKKDNYMSAKEAKSFGLIDNIVSHSK